MSRNQEKGKNVADVGEAEGLLFSASLPWFSLEPAFEVLQFAL